MQIMALTKDQFFEAVAQFVVDWGADEDHLIATMILLHCYRLTVGPSIQLAMQATTENWHQSLARMPQRLLPTATDESGATNTLAPMNIGNTRHGKFRVSWLQRFRLSGGCGSHS